MEQGHHSAGWVEVGAEECRLPGDGYLSYPQPKGLVKGICPYSLPKKC